MTKSPLHWLGPEMVRAGLLQSDEWVERSAREAVKLFPNQGMHAAATLLAVTHPNALDYLRHAPVLALAASHGCKTQRKRDRTYIAMNFGPLIKNGVKLKAVCDNYGVAYPLRKVSAMALGPSSWRAIDALSRFVPPSTLAQGIPDEASRHRHWLLTIHNAFQAYERRFFVGGYSRGDVPIARTDFLSWVLRALGGWKSSYAMPGNEISSVVDLFAAHPEKFNPRWSMERAIAESAEWHDANEHADLEARYGGRLDDKIDLGSWPLEAEYKGFTFHALDTLAKLIEEGKAMHHCVATYYSDVRSGRSRIYSVRKDGKRIATAEYNARFYPGAELVQAKAHCNARPSDDELRVMVQFESQLIRTSTQRSVEAA